jgi:hypothetical protein
MAKNKKKKVTPLTEGKCCKGGCNPPNISSERPPAPQGSGGMRVNPYATVVAEFEEAVAAYAGAPYAVAVDTCTDAIFLSLSCLRYVSAWDERRSTLSFPTNTYCSVINAALHAGFRRIHLTDEDWSGSYELKPTGIIDSALQFYRGMYKSGTYRCLSFQYRKHIPIGRGGMILTDDLKAADWFRLARFNGRPARPLDDKDAEPKFPGWLCHMEPERAARGLSFMMHAKCNYPDLQVDYPPLHEMDCYKPYLV